MGFSENLRFMIKRGYAKQQEFADAVGINRTTISKLLNGSPPTRRHIDILSKHFSVPSPDFWNLPHEKFKESQGLIDKETSLTLFKFRTIEENQQRAAKIQKKYKGTYSLYYEGSPESNGRRRFICSLLSVGEVTPEGIQVSILNPYDDHSCAGRLSAFRYRGYLFPLEKFLYILAEQEEGRYEVLSLIFHESSGPHVRTLRGMISGVGVTNERAYIAARPVFALLRNENETKFGKAVLKDCRYWLEDETSDVIKMELTGGFVNI